VKLQRLQKGWRLIDKRGQKLGLGCVPIVTKSEEHKACIIPTMQTALELYLRLDFAKPLSES
jgi:hypothetical protein